MTQLIINHYCTKDTFTPHKHYCGVKHSYISSNVAYIDAYFYWDFCDINITNIIIFIYYTGDICNCDAWILYTTSFLPLVTNTDDFGGKNGGIVSVIFIILA